MHCSVQLDQPARNVEVLPPVPRQISLLLRTEKDVRPQVYLRVQVPERVYPVIHDSIGNQRVHHEIEARLDLVEILAYVTVTLTKCFPKKSRASSSETVCVRW